MSTNPKTTNAEHEGRDRDQGSRDQGSDDQGQQSRSASHGDGSTPSNTEKDPDDWTTGGESMTGAQASYLKTLSEEAGEEFDPDLTKAEASKRIDALQGRTGRGRDH